MNEGALDGQFGGSYGGAITDNKEFVITDYSNSRVQKFDTDGTYISQFEVNQPAQVAVDSNDDILVVGRELNNVQRYDNDGIFVSQFGSTSCSNNGSIVDGGLCYPQDLAFDYSDNIFITDSQNGRIQKFSPSGTYMSQFGSYGSGNGQFIYPDGIAIDADSNVYVADTGNHRIQKFDSNGNFITKWGQQGNGDTDLSSPSDVTVDNNGNVYVANSDGGSIKKFSQNGVYLSTYKGLGLNEQPMIYPEWVQASGDGLLIAGSAYNSVVILCDNDVSTNNCTGSSGSPGQTLTYPDSEKGSTVSLTLPDDVTNPSVTAVDPDSIPKDGENQFPAGLTSFQFTTTPGATKTVTLYYDLPGNPNDYTARKYKTNSQTFIDVPGATITREDYNGKSMLKLTYSITDGGILDQDGLANGTVIDPVGLATTSLADTGENLALFLLGASTLVVGGVWLSRKAFKR